MKGIEPDIATLSSAIKLRGLETEILHAAMADRRGHMELYKSILDNAQDLIHCVTPQGTFHFTNKAWRKALGYSEDETGEMTLMDIIDESCREHCMSIFTRLMRGEKPEHNETVFVARDGKKIAVEGCCSTIFRNGAPVATGGIFRDVTKRKLTETALRLAYEEMEHNVSVRTQELMEANIALTVMLKQYEQNKKQLEQQILGNLTEKVFPIIERLKRSGLRDSQKNYIEIIEAGVREILSPCTPGIRLTLAGLTPSEQTVANLIKQGKTTKEIASFLRVATGTVNKHRENIRKKIGITNTRQPLEKTLLATT